MTSRSADLLHYREVQSIDRRDPADGTYAVRWGSDPSRGWEYEPGIYGADFTSQLLMVTYLRQGVVIDPAKPGVTFDHAHGRMVLTAVDWTEDNAGSTKRRFELKFRIVPHNPAGNNIHYKSTDWIRLDWTTSGSGVHITPASQTFHFDGGYQNEFNSVFEITLDAAPTTDDWLHCNLAAADDLFGMTFDSYDMSLALPDLATAVQQDYALPQAAHRITPHAQGAPATAWIFDVEAQDPNNEGSALRPDEQGEAEVVSSSYGGLSGKQVLTVQQDLRELQLHLRSTQTPTYVDEVDVYVITWAEELLGAHVVARARIGGSAPFDHRFLLRGLLRGQHIILVAAQQIASSLTHSLGSPHLRWDVSMTDANIPPVQQVAPGIIATWWQAFEKVADDVALFDDVPHPRFWLAVRTTSGGVISTQRWMPGDVIPASAGNPAAATPVLGPYAVRAVSASGQINHNRELQIWRDGSAYKARFYNLGSRETDVYLDRIEIDYLPGPAPPR